MKVGHKLLCKKQRGDTLSYVLKGKWYEISWLGCVDINLIGETGKEIEFRRPPKELGFYNLHDYFYTEKELLNMKLKKLKNNEIRV